MPKIMDPILPILSSLGYWAMILGTVGDPRAYTIYNYPGPHIEGLLIYPYRGPKMAAMRGPKIARHVRAMP